MSVEKIDNCVYYDITNTSEKIAFSILLLINTILFVGGFYNIWKIRKM